MSNKNPNESKSNSIISRPYENSYIQETHSLDLNDKKREEYYFWPDEPIDVKIIGYEQEQSSLVLLHTNVYIINISHCNHQWQIKRRYKNFLHLYETYCLFKTKLNLKNVAVSAHLSTTNYLSLTSSNHASTSHNNHAKRQQQPHSYPTSNNKFKPADHFKLIFKAIGSDFDQAKLILEKFLQECCDHQQFRYHNEMLKFLEVSHLSFINDLGRKMKEGLIKKKSFNVSCLNLFWDSRWLCIKDSYIVQTCPRSGRINCVILVDQSFKVACGLRQTGCKNGLNIENQSKSLSIKCYNEKRANEWYLSILHMLYTSGKLFINNQPFGSFAPVRQDSPVKWFIDGEGYMESIADALDAAQNEIFITGFFLSPEIYLKRPVLSGDKWRLDKILKRKADQNVKIYILIYKEIEMTLPFNSAYAKRVFAHRNIKVLRHPDHINEPNKFFTIMWAHHEKLVIIDQSVAFFGGIDLCYGRWDNHLHKLTDLGSVLSKKQPTSLQKQQPTEENKTSQRGDTDKTFDGPKEQQISSLRLDDNFNNLNTQTNLNFYNIGAKANDYLDNKRGSKNRLSVSNTLNLSCSDSFLNDTNFHHQHNQTPSYDFSNGNLTSHSKSLDDLFNLNNLNDVKSSTMKKQNFYERFINFRTNYNNSNLNDEYLITFKQKIKQNLTNLKQKIKINHNNNSSLNDSEMINSSFENGNCMKKSESIQSLSSLQGSAKLWIGKDYCNFIIRDVRDVHAPFEDAIDRTNTPRIPWHDIGGCVGGAAARDMARHFIQRWNFTKTKKCKNNPAYPLLMPKSYHSTLNNFQMSKSIFKNDEFTLCNVQALRSCSTWSAGISKTEKSIHEAMKHLIRTSKHYVYIENQFFISNNSIIASNEDNLNVIRNEIVACLYERISQASAKKENFKVYVFLPLMPGYEGEYGKASSVTLHSITHFNNSTINGLIKRLSDSGIEALNYICFFGLRTWGELNNKLVTELIYIHSKMMIVDDRACIIGSANINDRSLLGNRDSEIALLIEDTHFVPSKLNKQDCQVGVFSSKLRQKLFKEFLGLLDESNVSNDSILNNSQDISIDVTDPCSDEFYKNVMIKHAAQNTRIYDLVFRVLPCDYVRNFEELKDYQKFASLANTDDQRARNQLSKVKGYIVLYPSRFLHAQDLTPPFGTKEKLLPTVLWT